MLTWGCCPPPGNAVRMGSKQLWMPRKLSEDKTDSGVCPGELFGVEEG